MTGTSKTRKKRRESACLALLASALLLPAAGWAEDGKTLETIYLAANGPAGSTGDHVSVQGEAELPAVAAPSKTPADAIVPVFVPRTNRGAPAARIGGASRSGTEALIVQALVPRYDEAALTVNAQPTLYWHLSRGTPHAVNFTLVDPDAVEPIVDVTIEGPFEAGLQQIDVARYGAELEVDRAYQWFVAVVPDPERRSADIVARGAVRRVAASPELDRHDPVALAEAGIWYDALDSAAAPQRAALLEQVGIEIQ